MNISKLSVNVRCKYPRLLYWVNAPLLLLGLGPFAPSWMLGVSDIRGEFKGP